MLTKYSGASNSPEILPFLVGETIVAALFDADGRMTLVMKSGAALVIGSLGGGGPVFWSMAPNDVEHLVATRRQQIERYMAEIQGLPKPPRKRKPKKPSPGTPPPTSFQRLTNSDE